MPAVETPREAERPMDGTFSPGQAPAREAAPPSTEKSPRRRRINACRPAGFRQDGLDGRLKEVDEECAAEVDGLHSLSAEDDREDDRFDERRKSTLDDLFEEHDEKKATFWQTRGRRAVLSGEPRGL